MNQHMKKRFGSRQTDSCTGDVGATKTEFLDHAKLMPTATAIHTFNEAPTAPERVSVAPTTPGSTGIAVSSGISNRRRVVEVHGLNLEQLDPDGVRFIEPSAAGGEPIRSERTATAICSTSTDQRGSVDAMNPGRLERPKFMVVSGRYRKEPTNQ